MNTHNIRFSASIKTYVLCFCTHNIWTASSEFGTYCLCEQRRFRRACASAQSRQNLCCSLIQAASQEEPSDRKPDPWFLWMAGHAQLKFVMTECSKTQIRLTGLICCQDALMRTHNICFHGEMWQSIPKLSSNTHLIYWPINKLPRFMPVKELYVLLE